MALEPRWPIPMPQPEAEALAETLGVSPLCAILLLNRGIQDAASAQRFLVPGTAARVPPLADLDWVYRRLRQAYEKGERVAVWGDYDVDGLTSSALLLDCFGRRGLLIANYNPHRLDEGYGLNAAGLARLRAQGVGLVFTVDCGISNVSEVAAANELGIDVVITDHHDLPSVLPAAARIINHKLGDDALLKQLAGVGVAYQIAAGLCELWPADDRPEDYLDLLAVGTIADVAPLQGYNRDLVRQGLAVLAETTRPGLIALKNVANIVDRDPTALDVAFKLGPRLNAVGRMAHPDLALRLLMSTDLAEAGLLAAEIDGLNTARQALVARIQAEAEAKVADEVDLARDPLIVLADERWHHGVIGIVCSRLVEQFGRPVFLGCIEASGETRGSARSPGKVSISAALQATAGQLMKFGGHAPAGGFTLESERFASWRRALLAYASEYLDAADLRPELPIEAAPDLADVTLASHEEIAAMAPFGAANPEPLLAAFGAKVLDQKTFGKEGDHRRAFVAAGDGVIEVTLWRAGATPLPERIDLAYRVEHNEWRGKSSLRLTAQAWRPHLPEAVSETASARIEAPPVLIRRSEGELPWSLPAMLAEPPAWGRLISGDGREGPVPAGGLPRMSLAWQIEDRRGGTALPEADPAHHAIISYRNDRVLRPGAAEVVGEAIALMGLPEDEWALRAMMGACGTRRLLLSYDRVADPVALNAGWLHALASLLETDDPYLAAWEQLQSPPGLVRWGLQCLSELGVVADHGGVTRRGSGRGSRLLRELEGYIGYCRWDERRRRYWRVMAEGSPADIIRTIGETTDGDERPA